ncbi:hypothetical protein [Streptomyces albospinus]|uniref:hypothetical protein n=1 Tax=Streptomyces albospinus TaxID=285515 RepID=UPI001671735D|nr:hypothetical protein [Streptomyces albospinus]
MGFVDDDVVEGAAVEFLVGTGGGEVHGAGDVAAGADQGAGEDVLRRHLALRRPDRLEQNLAPSQQVWRLPVTSPRSS